MKKNLLLAFTLFMASVAFAQDKFPKQTLSINAFRNPSIGVEYQRKQVSIHAGYYLTNFESDVTTEFLKAGVTYWFLPSGKMEIPSSFYGGSLTCVVGQEITKTKMLWVWRQDIVGMPGKG